MRFIKFMRFKIAFFLKLSSHFFLTADSKAYFCNITQTCNI